MECCQAYFKGQLRWKMFLLRNENLSNFCVSVWQKNDSHLPLLVLRGFLFLCSIGIFISHMVVKNKLHLIRYIYFTHWGLLCIILTTGVSFAVSARFYFYKPVEMKCELPWYVKVYWILYNISIPCAFTITVFFHAFLANSGEYAPNEVMNVMVHQMNSMIMMLTLISAGHTSNILHFVQPLLFGIAYLLFGLLYYLAGGTDPRGRRYIYPMVDWSKPGPTVLVLVLTLLLLVAMHLLVVAISTARNALADIWKRHLNANRKDTTDIPL